MVNNSEKLRFAIVGATNTLIDFGIFFALSLSGINPLIANYASTTAALSFSFIANKKYTFKSTGGNVKKEVALFLTFTIIGLWILQPLVIAGVQVALEPANLPYWMLLIAAKVLATGVTLVWNYFTYSKIVFKRVDDSKNDAI